MTAAKLFIKHLFTSIRRRPVQPILLITIIVVAIIVCTLGFEIRGFMEEETTLGTLANYGTANITVSPGSLTEGKYLDTEAAARAIKSELGEDVSVVGSLELPLYIGEEKHFVYAATTELLTLGNVFDANLTSGGVTEQTHVGLLKKSIYITEDFASEYGLALDDAVTFSALGYEKTFTVTGISSKPLMGKYSVLVDVSAIRAIMVDKGLVSSVSADYFEPYGKLFIKVNDESVNEAIEILENKYVGYSVAVAENKEALSLINDIKIMMVMMVLLTAFLAIFTIYSCFSILTNQRKDENALFYAVGAKGYMLNMASAFELFLYWLVGGLIALGLSFPISKLFVTISEYQYCTGTVSASGFALSSLIVLGSAECSLLVNVVIEQIRKKRAKNQRIRSLSQKGKIAVDVAMLVLIAGMTAATVVTRLTLKNTLGFISICVVFVALFFMGRQFFTAVAGRISNSAKLPVTVRYAIKNSSRVQSQSNVTALISVFLTIFIFMFMMTEYTQGFLDYNRNIINVDYVVLNANEAVEKEITYDESGNHYTDRVVFNVYSDRQHILECADPVLVFGADNIIAFDYYGIERLPEEDEVYLGAPFMEQLNLDIGDTITFIDEKNELHDVEIIGTVNANARFAIVNAEGVGKTYSYIGVKTAEGADSRKLYESLFAQLEENTATVASFSEVVENRVAPLEIYYVCVLLFFITITIFAFIGIVDSIASGYRSRREQFDCYVGAGMNKRDIRIMKVSETLYSVIVGIVFTCIFFGPALFIVHQIGMANNMNIFYLI